MALGYQRALDLLHRTIGLKQGCPLSPTLFGLYIDEVSTLNDRDMGRGASFAAVRIPLLIYADE